MNPDTYSIEIEKYGVEFGEVVTPQINYQVAFCDWYDMDCLKILLTHEDPAELLGGLQAYYDNGSEEVSIYSRVIRFADKSGNSFEYEQNYKEYLPVINDWYLERTGKYDPIETI